MDNEDPLYTDKCLNVVFMKYMGLNAIMFENNCSRKIGNY